MFQHILVVCTGNICRSPVAAAMLRQRLPGRDISSAGLGALVGSDVEPRARALAEADGIEVGAHKARQLDTDLLSQADLILVMSDGQRREIGKQWPEMLGKTLRLGQWLEGGEGRDIPDPYRKSTEVFEHVHRLLAQASETWASRM
ncbi:low molecular weight protein-tyrosine-phosphatase [Halomonas sp. E14]|uniref:low molecular weight protein-tyrosine-phosphatase n=1 Tax=Halomonas sp. E14 TaxID=3397245 RepID=UPI00403EF0A1